MLIVCYSQMERFMKSQTLTLIASVSIFAMSPTFAMEGIEDKESRCISAYNGLKWQDRPTEIQNKISQTFSYLSSKSGGTWLFNGSEYYIHADVDTEKLAKHLMTSNPNQKEFYFLDIGAGNFEWGDHLAGIINEFTGIADDVKVNIIGVRGEQYNGEKFTTVGKCNIFKLGQFKIENLEEAFKKINLDLTDKIDCIYTRWTFRHLVDPVGTLEQAYNLLKPKTGLFFGDGFFYSLNGQSAKDILTNARFDNITRLLLDMKVQFLIEPHDSTRAINRFVFKRNADGPLNLPLKYTGMVYVGDACQVYSQVATAFEHIGPEPTWIGESPYPTRMYDKLCGNLDFFNFFKNNSLFYWGEYDYSSLINK